MSNMFESHADMVAKLSKPGQEILNEMNPEMAHVLHMAVGIAGEAGELLEAVVDAPYVGDAVRAHIVEEMGDIEYYLEGLRQGVGMSKEETLATMVETNVGLMISSIRVSLTASAMLDAIKKATMYNKPMNTDAVRASFSAIEWHLMAVRTSLGITYQEVIDHNIAKLSKRYASGSFSNEQAQERADKKVP